MDLALAQSEMTSVALISVSVDVFLSQLST